MLFECFKDKQRYINVDEEITIYYETIELMKIWKNLIIKNSNIRITELTRDHQKILSNIIPYLDIPFNDHQVIGPQLDKRIVEIMLWSASSVFPYNLKLIEEVFAKTKSSIFQYFYHDLIIEAFLKLKKPNLAIDVIKHLYSKDHTAHYFSILKYDVSKFANKEFARDLKDYQFDSSIKLLSKGEKVNLVDVSYNDLLNIIKKIDSQKEGL